MARNIAVGIDVGTHRVRVVVAERVVINGKRGKRVIGTGTALSRGLRHGYVINTSEAVHSIREAVAAAENAAGMRISRAHISIGGISLEGQQVHSTVAISRADAEITELDIERVLEEAERYVNDSPTTNQRIIHTAPVGFQIDGKDVLGYPSQMKGVKLDAHVLLVTALEQHIKDIIQAVEEAGVEVEDIVASPFAASMVTLTKTQKIAGVLLANIGSETVSVTVYENNMPISLKVFPIGSTDITNDIALGLQVPLDEAESIKLGKSADMYTSRKKLDTIIQARLADIFELIQEHLVALNKDGLLPAGIVMTGGGAGIATIDDLAKATLKLPSSIADLGTTSSGRPVKDSSWSVAYGLAILGLNSPEGIKRKSRFMRSATQKLQQWFRQFLP